MRRFAVLIAAIALTPLLSVGCKTDTAPSPGMGDFFPAPMNDPQISIVSPELREWLGFQPAIVVKEDGRPMTVETPVRNLTYKQYLIEYRYIFHDERGRELNPVMGWAFQALDPKQIARLKEAHGADAFGGLISSRCTNEDLYLFQKFMRLVIGTNNLDSSARYGHVNGVQAMRRVQGTHRWTVTFEDIVNADVLLLVGTSITETNPVSGLRVKEAVKKRQARLLTIEATEPGIDSISNITNLAQQHIGVPTAHFGDALLGLLKGVADGRHMDPSLQSRAAEYVSAVSEALGQLTWTNLEAATGASRDRFLEMAATIAQGRRVVVVAGQDLLRSVGGYGACLNLLDLLLLTGKLAETGCGFAPLAEENNDQGAVEMGAVAELLPGALDVAAADERSLQVHDQLHGVWHEQMNRPQSSS